MLSILSHVTTVLPTPSKKYCKKIETITTNFIRGEHTPHTKDEAAKLKVSIVSQDVIFPPKPTMALAFNESPPSGLL